METITNTPCSECQDTETPLHTNGKCGNCWEAPDLLRVLCSPAEGPKPLPENER